MFKQRVIPVVLRKLTLFITALILIIGCTQVNPDEGTYKNGEPWEGKWIGRYQTGEKMYEETYQDGELTQKIEWYKNGQKLSEGSFKNGKLDGKWTWWYDNGKLKRETIFLDDEVVKSSQWDKDGNLK